MTDDLTPMIDFNGRILPVAEVTALRVTFQSHITTTKRGKTETRYFEFEEIIKDESSARLRALALNWKILKSVPYK